MLAPIAMNMHVPAAAAIAETFSIPRPNASLTVTVYLWVFGSTMMLVGLPADRFGRRPSLLWGLGILGAGALLAALSSGGLNRFIEGMGGVSAAPATLFTVLLFARAFKAVGAAAVVVIPRTMINDRTQGAEAVKLLGLLGTIMAAAPALAPVLGEILSATLGWPAIFGAQAVLAAVLFTASFFLLPETRPELEQSGATAVVQGEFRRVSEVAAPVAVMALMTALYFAYLAAGADAMLMHFNEKSVALAALLTSLASVYVIGNMTVARIAGRYELTSILRTGTIFTVVSLPVILWGSSYFVVSVGMCIYAYGNGLVMPTALAMAGSVEPRLRARVMSVASASPFLLGGGLALLATTLNLTSWGRFRYMMLACVILSTAIAWSRGRARRVPMGGELGE